MYMHIHVCMQQQLMKKGVMPQKENKEGYMGDLEGGKGKEK